MEGKFDRGIALGKRWRRVRQSWAYKLTRKLKIEENMSKRWKGLLFNDEVIKCKFGEDDTCYRVSRSLSRHDSQWKWRTRVCCCWWDWKDFNNEDLLPGDEHRVQFNYAGPRVAMTVSRRYIAADYLKKSPRGVLSSSVRKYVTVSPELSWFYFRKIYFSRWNQWHDLLIGVIRNNVGRDVGCVGLEINSGLSRSIRDLFTLHRGPAGLRKVLPCLFHRTSTRDFGLNAFTTWPIRRQSISISLFSLCPFPLLFLLRSHL